MTVSNRRKKKKMINSNIFKSTEFITALFLLDVFLVGSLWLVSAQEVINSNFNKAQLDKIKTTYQINNQTYFSLPNISVKSESNSKSGVLYNYAINESPLYKAYFRTNSNTAKPVRFEKDGYFFIYDVSGESMNWVGQAGKPVITDTLGSGAPSNSQNSILIADTDNIIYKGAFYNTDIKYEMNSEMMKETFILSGLPSIKNYDYLRYTGHIYFNSSLKICTDEKCYTPKGTEDNFETSGKIYFKDSKNKTIFFLIEPIIKDSTGKEVLGKYVVRSSNAQMVFELRIPTTFIKQALFPIYADPTVVSQIDKKVSFSIDNLNNVTAILYKKSGGSFINHVGSLFVSFDNKKYKFGAIDTLASGENWSQYKYAISSNKLITKINNSQSYKIGGYILDLSDICSKVQYVNNSKKILNSANCMYKLSNTKSGASLLEVTFYSDGNIDPSFIQQENVFIKASVNNAKNENFFAHLQTNNQPPYGGLFTPTFCTGTLTCSQSDQTSCQAIGCNWGGGTPFSCGDNPTLDCTSMDEGTCSAYSAGCTVSATDSCTDNPYLDCSTMNEGDCNTFSAGCTTNYNPGYCQSSGYCEQATGTDSTTCTNLGTSCAWDGYNCYETIGCGSQSQYDCQNTYSQYCSWTSAVFTGCSTASSCSAFSYGGCPTSFGCQQTHTYNGCSTTGSCSAFSYGGCPTSFGCQQNGASDYCGYDSGSPTSFCTDWNNDNSNCIAYTNHNSQCTWHEPLPAGLKLYYPFDVNKFGEAFDYTDNSYNGATYYAYDIGLNNIKESVYGYNGTTGNSFEGSMAGIINGSISLKDGWINSKNLTLLPTASQSRSVSIWFYRNSYTGSYDAGGSLFGYGAWATSQSFDINIYNDLIYFVGNSNDLWGNSKITSNTWHNVVVTFNGSNNNTRIYLDGRLDSSGTNGLKTVTSGTEGIMMGYDPQAGYFDGQLDEVSMWNVTLTPTEIYDMYNKGMPKPLIGNETGIIRLFHLDEHYDLEREGKYDKGAYFNSTNYIRTTTTPKFISGDFAISTWINWTGGDDTYLRTILGRGQAGGDQDGDFILALQSDNSASFTVSSSSNWIFSYGDTSTLKTTAIPKNEWHMVTVSKIGNNYTMYLDDTPTSSIEDTTLFFDSANTHAISIGKAMSAYSLAYTGEVDEVMIFNTGLDQSNITQIYNAQSPRFKSSGNATTSLFQIVAGNSFVNATVNFYKRLFGTNVSLSIGEANNNTSDYMDNLFSSYSLDETSGTNIYDRLGTHNSTFAGNVANMTTTGILNNAYKTKPNMWVNLTRYPEFEGTDNNLSISFWMKTNITYEALVYGYDRDDIAGNDNSNVDQYMIINTGQAGTLRLGAVTGCEATALAYGINDNIWHNIITTTEFKATGAKYQVFVDGTLKVNGTCAGQNWNSVQTDYRLKFGHNSNIGWFNGTFDEINLFNKALTQSEVNNLYDLNNRKFNLTTAQNLSAIDINDNQSLNIFNISSLTTYIQIMFGLVSDSYQFFTPLIGGNNIYDLYSGGVIDTTKPLIQFVNPTNLSGVSTNVGTIKVNITASDETSLANITLNLYNSTHNLINSTNTTTSPLYFQFINLPDGIYFYNATATDSSNNQNSTETRNITIGVPPVCTLLSRTPANILDNSTGVLEVIMNCTDSSGINITKTGDHYAFFITRAVDAFILAPGIPNYWSNRYPNNSLGVVGSLTPPYKIWRALGRNEGYWYENIASLKDCTGLTPCYQPLNDTFSFAIEDGDYGHLTVTPTDGTNTSVIINYTHPAVDVSAFRQSIYLSYESMVKESKKNFTIKNNNYVLTKRFDAEAYRGTQNYTMNSLRNLGVVGTPTKTLRAFYCNSSYNPAGTTQVINSPNCALINSLTSTEINNRILTDRNSSYSKGTYGITNGKFAGITATAEFYIEYESPETSASKYYQLRYVNGTTNTDIKFNETNVAWTTTNGGTTWTQAPWTPDVMTTSTRSANDDFIFGLYVTDYFGNAFKNFTLFSDEITTTNHPISAPLVLEYNSTNNPMNINLNGTYKGLMTVRIGVAKDPDSVGNVTHNLSLFNIDGTFNKTINGSFLAPNDAPIWINFDTSTVPDGNYRMNIFARAGDNALDIQNRTTDRNFTIDNTSPYFTTIPNNVSENYGNGLGVLFSGNDAISFDSYSIGNWTNKFSINSTGFLKNTSSLSVGEYIINVTINDSAGNTNMTWFNLTINKASSQVYLNFSMASPKNYGTPITPFCGVLMGEGTSVLTKNSSVITSGNAITLGVGTWNFTCSMDSTQNYTSSYNQSDFIINQAPQPIVTLLNGIDTDINITIVYPTQFNASWTGANQSETTIQLDGITINRAVNYSWAGGFHKVNWSSPASENYSAYISTRYINITKANPILTFLANGNISNLTLEYPQQINISAKNNSGFLGLDINNVNFLANNSLNSSLTLGEYIFRANISGNENYSDIAYSYYNITIKDTTKPTIIIYSPTNIIYNYSEVIVNFTATDNFLVSSLWFNNGTTNITYTTPQTLNLTNGSYSMIFYANDSVNNLANISVTFLVNTTASIIPPVISGGGGGGGVTITNTISPMVLDSALVYADSNWSYNRYYPINIETFDNNSKHIDIDNILITVSEGSLYNISSAGVIRKDTGVYQIDVLFSNSSTNSANITLAIIQQSKIIHKSLVINFVTPTILENIKYSLKSSVGNFFERLYYSVIHNLILVILLFIFILAIIFIMLFKHIAKKDNR